MRAALVEQSIEQRKFDRTATVLNGKMFVPAEDRTVECGVVDISAGGAGITCTEMPPLETFVVLYIDEYGRFEAVVTRVVGDVLGLRFVCSDAKRKRLIAKLANAVSVDEAHGASLRLHRRIRISPISTFTRCSGDRVECEIVDISLTGASLNTATRPPNGEMILIGQMAARVVRQHDQGVGIVFATTS
jgi:hypothetical protein